MSNPTWASARDGMLDPNKARSKDELVKLLKFEMEQKGIEWNEIRDVKCANTPTISALIAPAGMKNKPPFMKSTNTMPKTKRKTITSRSIVHE